MTTNQKKAALAAKGITFYRQGGNVIRCERSEARGGVIVEEPVHWSVYTIAEAVKRTWATLEARGQGVTDERGGQ